MTQFWPAVLKVKKRPCPEKPESVKIEVENSHVVRYVDAETSL